MKTTDPKTLKYLLNMIIGLAFMFLFPLIPSPEPITSVGMTIIGVFVGMVFMWNTVDGIWPELLGLIIIAFSGYLEGASGSAAIKTVFASAFGSDTVLGIVLCMFAFGSIEGVGLPKYIARFFLSRKSLEGRPYILMFYFMTASYVLSGLTAALISLFVLWPVAVEVCEKCGLRKGDGFFYSLICGIYFGATVGQPMLPFKGAILAVLSSFERSYGMSVDTFRYIVLNVIMAVLVFAAYILFVKFILHPELGGLKTLKADEIMSEKLGAMNRAQKITGIASAAMIILMVVPSILPSWIPGVALLDSLGLIGITCIYIAALLIFRDENNKPLINLKDYAKSSFSWAIFFQTAAALYIANALTSESTGISLFITNIINGVLGDSSFVVFVVVIIFSAVLITNIANNMALGIVFMSIISACAQNFIGVNITALAVMTAISVFIALLTPGASVYCSMLHARKDLVSTKEILTVFAPLAFIVAVLYMVIGYPLASLLF